MPRVDSVIYVVSSKHSSSYDLPNRSLSFHGKLFLWTEADRPTNDSLIASINKRGLIDSTPYKYELGLIPIDSVSRYLMSLDGDIKGSTYIFCKSNPTKIVKRIKTSIWLSPDNPILRVDCK